MATKYQSAYQELKRTHLHTDGTATESSFHKDILTCRLEESGIKPDLRISGQPTLTPELKSKKNFNTLSCMQDVLYDCINAISLIYK